VRCIHISVLFNTIILISSRHVILSIIIHDCVYAYIVLSALRISIGAAYTGGCISDHRLSMIATIATQFHLHLVFSLLVCYFLVLNFLLDGIGKST
jgi:hypothetical protein